MLAAIALIGILASLFPVVAKVKAERENRYYDIIIDYASLKRMASQSEHDVGYWLDLFADAGINKVALYELTATDMSDDPMIPVHVSSISKIVTSQGWEQRYPKTVVGWINECTEPLDALIVAETPEVYELIMSAFSERLADFDCMTCTEDGESFIYISSQSGHKGVDLLELCLCIWQDTADLIESRGMKLIPRTTSVKKMNSTEYAESYFKTLEKYASPYFINGGKELIGAEGEGAESLLADFMSRTGARIGLIEQNDQSQNLMTEGEAAVLSSTGYEAVRVFNVWPYIQNRYKYCGYEGPEEITNSLFRAIVERNCKVVYMKMILEPDNDISVDADEEEWIYVTEPEAYTKLFSDLDARLKAQGFELGEVPVMKVPAANTLIKAVAGIGMAALFVMLADMFLFLDNKWRYGLLALGAMAAVAAAFVIPEKFKLLLSMGTGIVMPSLAGVGLSRVLAEKRAAERGQPKFVRVLIYTLLAAVITIFTAFLGSVMATSSLSEISYLLEINLYRGVKLMQIIPIGFFMLGYLLVYAYEESGAKKALLNRIGTRGESGRREKLYEYLRELMDKNVKLGFIVFIIAVAVAAVFLGGAGIYYIYRTGNSMNISATELAARNFLENTLAARPRTKEMIIGWPMLMLFIWSLRRRMKFIPFVFGVGASIGLVSIVNTFLHIRTPFLFNLLRSGWGLLFGVVIGVVLVLAAEIIYNLIKGKNGGASNV